MYYDVHRFTVMISGSLYIKCIVTYGFKVKFLPFSLTEADSGLTSSEPPMAELRRKMM